jgi:DNA-3-methyladenine glycosylase I
MDSASRRLPSTTRGCEAATPRQAIVRKRLKIAAAIQNAKAFLAVSKEFGSFDAYL